MPYFSIETPAIKKMPPKMDNAHGFNDVIGVPKIPKTPKIKPAIPAMVKTNAKILIIIKFISSKIRIFYKVNTVISRIKMQ